MITIECSVQSSMQNFRHIVHLLSWHLDKKSPALVYISLFCWKRSILLSSIWFSSNNHFDCLASLTTYPLFSPTFSAAIYASKLFVFLVYWMRLPVLLPWIWMVIWAATWQNQQNECASSEDSDQPGIHPVCSESSLSAWRHLGSLATHWAHSEDSGQTGRMPRLIWVFAGRTHILLVLSCRGLFELILLAGDEGSVWYRRWWDSLKFNF